MRGPSYYKLELPAESVGPMTGEDFARTRRKVLRVSQQMMADMLGIKRNVTISDWEQRPFVPLWAALATRWLVHVTTMTRRGHPPPFHGHGCFCPECFKVDSKNGTYDD